LQYKLNHFISFRELVTTALAMLRVPLDLKLLTEVLLLPLVVDRWVQTEQAVDDLGTVVEAVVGVVVVLVAVHYS
jgi:hypothetical protein